MRGAVLLLSLLAACAPARAGADDLNELMQLLGARTHARSEFIEQQFLHVLKRPLESRGQLVYDAPDRLEKHTLEPRREALVVVGDVLTLERGTHRRVLNLRDFPQVAPFVTAIRATLAGDRAGLERVFHMEFAGDLAQWTLTLAPLDATLAQSITRIRIDGAEANLRRVEITQPDGDRSVMTMRDSPAS
jgi:outer membrane lipoprotein-sorting protein